MIKVQNFIDCSIANLRFSAKLSNAVRVVVVNPVPNNCHIHGTEYDICITKRQEQCDELVMVFEIFVTQNRRHA
jgi:pseudouridine-5'-phosphate glycosidase